MHIRSESYISIVAGGLEFFISKLAIFIEHKVIVASVTTSLRRAGESLGTLVRRELQ